MKPKLHQMPSGDWIPIEQVMSIVVNPARTDEITSQKPHVIVYFDGGRKVYNTTETFEEAKKIAADLGKAVNHFRETFEYAELTK